MSEVKWIKIVTDIFDDEKILLIEALPERDSIIVIWFKLLCLAGKQNNGGVFMLNDRIPYTDEMLATIFRRPVNTVRLALNTFEQFGMVEIVNDTITIPNWGKHQNLDALQARKDYMRAYMREYRKRAPALPEEASEIPVKAEEANSKCLRKCFVSVIDKEEEEEEEKEKEKEKRKRKAASRFSPPSVDEIRAYCAERGNSVDPERFFDYYESNGWMIGGKSKMKDWRAALRGWEKRQGSYGGSEARKPVPASGDAYSTDRLLAMLDDGE